jgi:mono/diheme cytochrome c family protein
MMKNIISCGLMSLFMVILVPAYGQMGKSESTTDAGKEVYQKANCVGCHKWHGGGGGGYGGMARSLRQTGLDAESLKMVIRCGRPNTGMPFHDRKAYQGDDISCYGVTREALGASMPSRARSFLREQQIDEVVNYVLTHLKGKGEPTHEECEEFWGKGSRQCQSM